MSALRVLRSLATSSSRTASVRAFTRSIHVPRLGSQLAPRTALPAARWFSASARVMGDGSCELSRRFCRFRAKFAHTADLALSQKLAEELKYEQDAAEAEEPDFLTAFKKRGAWEVREHMGCTPFQYADDP